MALSKSVKQRIRFNRWLRQQRHVHGTKNVTSLVFMTMMRRCDDTFGQEFYPIATSEVTELTTDAMITVTVSPSDLPYQT